MGKTVNKKSASVPPLEECSLEAVRADIVKHIRKRYGMTVAEFARSKHAKAIFGNKISESSLRSYLSSGATSLPVIQKLCSHFGMGKITKQEKRVTTVTYYIER